MNKAPFAPGELVVCVEGCPPYLTEGLKYVVSEVDGYHAINLTQSLKNDGWTCRVFGADHSIGGKISDGWWKCVRFRPLNPDDFQKIREKHGEPVKKAKERTE